MTKVNKFLHHFAIFLGLRSAVDYDRLGKVLQRKEQYTLGMMYFKGDGVPQSDAEAFKCFYRAADQGCAHAQSMLGRMYVNGYGVPKDDVEAAKWYRMAEEQGDAQAQTAFDRILSQKEQDNLFRVPGLKSEERGHQVPPWSVHE